MERAIGLSGRTRTAHLGAPAIALAATLIAGVVIEHGAYPGDPAAGAADLAVAVVFIACGTAVHGHARRGDLTAALMVATGVTWLLGTMSSDLALLHRGPLLQLLVTAPSGRPRTAAEIGVVAFAYVEALVPALGRDDGVTVALAVLVAGAALARWASASGALRRARAVPATASVAVALVLLAGVLGDAGDADAVLWAWEATLVATALGLAADLRFGGWAQSAITSVVIDLGRGRPASLTATLAEAVGDPSLVVAYREAEGSYSGEDGRPVVLPAERGGRTVTTVDVDGRPAAALVHDAILLRGRGVSEAVTTAVRMALENRWLEADIRASVRDTEASRARLLRARDAERRRLEDRLDGAVGPRLDAASLAIAEVEAEEAELAEPLRDELTRTREELRRFASGLHPRALETGGLDPALRELAQDAPLTVEVSAACGRLDEDVETAAWFVCSEGVANVVKHAGASRATITAELHPAWLVVSVEDDGVGGADPAEGRGLRGLAARVEAAGGRLEVRSHSGRGTRLVARLPVGARV
jgi:signal transduction histidine kinase